MAAPASQPTASLARDQSNPVVIALDHPGWPAAEQRALAYDRRRAVHDRRTGTTLVLGNGGDYTVRPEHGGYSCTCPAFGPCWHIAIAQPLCINCREDRAAVGLDHCRGCAEVLAGRGVPLASQAPEPVAIIESTPEQIAESRAMWLEARDDYLAALRAPLPFRPREESVAEANARALAAHTFVPGSTELACRNPFAGL